MNNVQNLEIDEDKLENVTDAIADIFDKMQVDEMIATVALTVLLHRQHEKGYILQLQNVPPDRKRSKRYH